MNDSMIAIHCPNCIPLSISVSFLSHRCKIHLLNDAFVLVMVISLQKQTAGRVIINRSNLLPVKAKTALPDLHLFDLTEILHLTTPNGRRNHQSHSRGELVR